MSDKKQDEELNNQIGKGSAALQALHYLFAMKRELLSKKEKALKF